MRKNYKLAVILLFSVMAMVSCTNQQPTSEGADNENTKTENLIDPEEERVNKEIADGERSNNFAIINDDVSEFEFRMSGLIGNEKCTLMNAGWTDENGIKTDFQIQFSNYGDSYIWFTHVTDFDKETGRLIMDVSTIMDISIGKFVGYVHGEVSNATYKGRFISNDGTQTLQFGFFDDRMYWGAY